jgi:hypothetical protein
MVTIWILVVMFSPPAYHIDLKEVAVAGAYATERDCEAARAAFIDDAVSKKDKVIARCDQAWMPSRRP